MDKKAIQDGAADGMYAFLAERPISVIDPLIDACAKACGKRFECWLDAHEEEIIAAIAKTRANG
jgi:hypothetical protein